MAVPERPVHKDDELVLFEADVWLAGKGFLGGFVADASLPEGFFEELLGLGAFGADPGHVVGPLGGGIEAVFLTKLGDRYSGPYVGLGAHGGKLGIIRRRRKCGRQEVGRLGCQEVGKGKGRKLKSESWNGVGSRSGQLAEGMESGKV